MTKSTLETLSEINGVRSQILAQLARSLPSIKSYCIKSHDGLSRIPNDAKLVETRSGTAFAAGVLARAGILKAAFPDGMCARVMKYVGQLPKGAIGTWLTKDDAPQSITLQIAGGPPQQIQKLSGVHAQNVNQYTVQVRLAGYLLLADRNPNIVDANSIKGISDAVRDIIEVTNRDGFMNRLSDAVPSAYLTLWSTSALLLGTKVRAQVLELQPEFPEDINQLLEKISRWATATLERNIAGRSAKIVGHFDVIECLCAACIVATLNRRLPRKPRDGTLQLAEHAIGLLLDNYFDEGSFKSVAQCSPMPTTTQCCAQRRKLFSMCCAAFRRKPNYGFSVNATVGECSVKSQSGLLITIHPTDIRPMLMLHFLPSRSRTCSRVRLRSDF